MRATVRTCVKAGVIGARDASVRNDDVGKKGKLNFI